MASKRGELLKECERLSAKPGLISGECRWDTYLSRVPPFGRGSMPLDAQMPLSLRQLEEILDLHPDPFVVIRHRDDIVVRCNAAYAKSVGKRVCEVVGHPIAEIDLSVVLTDLHGELYRVGIGQDLSRGVRGSGGPLVGEGWPIPAPAA